MLGADHAPELLAAVAAGLALAALCTVLFAALCRRRCERVARWRNTSPFELVAGGAVAYALIELAEGNSPLDAGAWQFAALVVSAFIVSGVARLIARYLRISGEALAVFAASISQSRFPYVLLAIRRSLHAERKLLDRSCRGRAPPLFS